MPGAELTLVLATSNLGKLEDFRLLFEGNGIRLELPAEHGITLEVEETGASFRENAFLKARAAQEATGLASLADDSGLVVPALGGAPGVRSARYAGPECDDHANNQKLIAELEGQDDRRASFVCVLACVLADGSELAVEGRCDGRVSGEERGSNGFGYDSVFFREDLGRTFGEATPEEKNARSHRATAVASLLAELRRRGLIG